MDFEMDAKLSNMENRLLALEAGFLAANAQRDEMQATLLGNTSAIDTINANTQEIVELFRDAKVGAKFIKNAISIAKSLGTLAVAVAAIWALIYAWRHGIPPVISNGP